MRLLLCLLATVGPAHAKLVGPVEAVYEDFGLFDAHALRPSSYTLHSGQGKYAGTIGAVPVGDAGSFVGGGLAVGVVLGFRYGAQLSLQMFQVAGGGVIGGAFPFRTGTALSLSMAAGFGWEWIFGRVLLHASTVVGFDHTSLYFEGLPDAVRARLPPFSYAGNDFRAEGDATLRFGEQVGVHVRVAPMVAVFAEAEIDYGPGWHVASGIALGEHEKKKR